MNRLTTLTLTVISTLYWFFALTVTIYFLEATTELFAVLACGIVGSLIAIAWTKEYFRTKAQKFFAWLLLTIVGLFLALCLSLLVFGFICNLDGVIIAQFCVENSINRDALFASTFFTFGGVIFGGLFYISPESIP